MRYEKVCVEAVSYALPETSLTTAALEASLAPLYGRLRIAKGTVQALTGVVARKLWDEGVQPSQAATLAAERLFEESGFDRQRVQILVSTSVCKDYLEPSTASLAHGNLGLGRHCLNFDIGNACLGFMSGMVTVANMIELGQIQAGLVVAGEGSRSVTRATVQTLQRPGANFTTFKDNIATLTLGSGASAMLLVHESIATRGHRLLGGIANAATEWNHLCVGTEEGMKTDPATLLREGVALAELTWSQVQEELDITEADVKEFALHQVGRANHDALLQALKLNPTKAMRIYPQLGNVGACGVPLTVAKAVEAGRVGEGELCMLMGIGSGLNCQMMGLRW